MSLIKCSECGQDVSTEAELCPHCGKPNLISSTEKPEDKSGSHTVVGGFFIAVVIIALLYFVYRTIAPQIFNQVFNSSGRSPNIAPQNNAESGQAVVLDEIKNLGFDFYIGQIDNTSVTNLTDDFKNQITKIAYNAHIPTTLLKSVPIIVLNNLALTGNQYIPTGGVNLKVPDLKPDFLSEGGLYLTWNGGLSVIFINKPIIAQGQLTEVLTHELGHAIGSKLTDQDWVKYYQLRGIPSTTARHGTNWNLSPEEDFAEVYKNVFTGIDVRTYYGELLPRMSIDIGPCMQTYLTAENSYRPKVDSSDPKG
jgi:hypothetical protein